MIEELIKKTDTNAIIWIKVYSSIFTLRVVYKEYLYVLFSSVGEANLHVLTTDGVFLKCVSDDSVRELYTAAKKQFFGPLHDQTYKRK